MILPRQSLVTICKSFIKRHFEYGDIIFDQAVIKTFHDNLGSIQYNTSFTTTCAIKSTSREELYQGLDFKYLQQKRWFCQLCTFCKTQKNQSPRYLYNLLPLHTRSLITTSFENIRCFHFKHNIFYFFSFLKLLNATI